MAVRRLDVLAHRTASFLLGTGNANQWWGIQVIFVLLDSPSDVHYYTSTSSARIHDVDEIWRFLNL